MAKKKLTKNVKKKPAKKRASKYDGKLKIIGTLDEVLKVSISKPN